MSNYQYKPNQVIAWQNADAQHSERVPDELQNHLVMNSHGTFLKNPGNTQVLSPVDKNKWVVKDVTKTPQLFILSEFKFAQMFERVKPQLKKDGKVKK